MKRGLNVFSDSFMKNTHVIYKLLNPTHTDESTPEGKGWPSR